MLTRCYNIYGKNLSRWSRGVAWSNTLPCQGRDRGFESRRLRTNLKALRKQGFLIYMERRAIPIADIGILLSFLPKVDSKKDLTITKKKKLHFI